jgi:hypothetical protein
MINITIALKKRYLKSNRRTNKHRPNEPTYDLQGKGNK